MLNRLILKVTKFQLPPSKRLGTVVKNILGGHHAPPPCQIRLKEIFFNLMNRSRNEVNYINYGWETQCPYTVIIIKCFVVLVTVLLTFHAFELLIHLSPSLHRFLLMHPLSLPLSNFLSPTFYLFFFPLTPALHFHS